MKGFDFKLQTVLELKSKIEEQRKIELGFATQKYEKQLLILKDLFARKSDANKMKKKLVESTVNIVEFANYTNYIERLDKDIVKQEETVKKEEENLNLAKKNLYDVMQERKAYEKLKEKKLEIYKKEMLSKEQKNVDEIVTYNHSKNRED
ncbi:MAG: flagellar export protein FliJ [Lachnospirales bacterium]